MVFICAVLCIPIYFLLFLGIVDPRELIMWGNRWKFKEEPELSDELLRITKYSSLVCIIVLTLIWIATIISFFK
ncbi:hypothetical protein OEV98_13430 [Caldibacillus lycopersici]|uniref:DUF6199 domain-containing protein n=1 Tax=Perspicuibacillus lycopersici TaxID=1325689 RepID=A0AAE3ITW3_9BACI|nr:hypothetical protein [Perspicuibacillus lycopersici]MCU9614540.1 hypothetical protein [Perspicuibacillus lycopersici]